MDTDLRPGQAAALEAGKRMGGMTGEVRGPTKIATWLAFQRELKGLGLHRREDQDAQRMYLAWPANKRDAYRLMRKTSDGTCWILEYHLHS